MGRPITTVTRRRWTQTPRPVPERDSGPGNDASPRPTQRRQGREKTETTAACLWSRSRAGVRTRSFRRTRNPSPGRSDPPLRGCNPGNPPRHEPGWNPHLRYRNESPDIRHTSMDGNSRGEGKKNPGHHGPIAETAPGRQGWTHPSHRPRNQPSGPAIFAFAGKAPRTDPARPGIQAHHNTVQASPAQYPQVVLDKGSALVCNPRHAAPEPDPPDTACA